jgi:hypothetical protein
MQVAWQMLGVPQLNAELRSPVTSAELQAQSLSDKGRLTNDNAATLLPPFEVDLGIAAAGQGPRVFYVGLRNEGQLPLKWELHSYDTPEVRCQGSAHLYTKHIACSTADQATIGGALLEVLQ